MAPTPGRRRGSTAARSSTATFFQRLPRQEANGLVKNCRPRRSGIHRAAMGSLVARRAVTREVTLTSALKREIFRLGRSRTLRAPLLLAFLLALGLPLARPPRPAHARQAHVHHWTAGSAPSGSAVIQHLGGQAVTST